MLNNRRNFIKKSALLATGMGIGFHNELNASNIVHDKIERKINSKIFAFTDGCLRRNFTEGNEWKRTLRMTAEMGYIGIEGKSYMGTSAKEYKKFCDGEGITALIGGGFMVELQTSISQIIDLNKELGRKVWNCWVPWVDGGNSEDEHCKRTAEQLNKYGEILKQNGIRLWWHNHDGEFRKIPYTNLRPIDLLMKYTDPKLVGMCMDIYWVKMGEADPLKVLEQYPGRVDALHLKDMEVSEKRKNTAPGLGLIDFSPILTEAMNQNIEYYIVENEGEKYGLDCLGKSADYLLGLNV